MPTEQQSWLNRYNTYYAATEYNRKQYGKRIKQLKRMLKDEKFWSSYQVKSVKRTHYYSWQNQMSLICILHLMNKVNHISKTTISD